MYSVFDANIAALSSEGCTETIEYPKQQLNLISTMKHSLHYLLLLLLCTAYVPSFAQYELVWSDEFEGNTLNPASWNVEHAIGIWNTGSNAELQHYKKNNVSVGQDENGNSCLVLTANKENYNGYSFTSGKVTTQSKFNFKYGKIEARIKVPNLQDGLWPAFWLLGYTPEVWPKCGEIDVVEWGHAEGIANNTQNTTFGGALHWENDDSYAGYGTSAQASTALNNDFHTYSMVWTPTEIKMYLDNASSPYYAMNITGDDAEEFREKQMYLIFNLAVGGSFTGITNPNDITAPLPAKMYIDYVRVYQDAAAKDFSSCPAVYGNFGVFAETSTIFGLDNGFDGIPSTTNLTTSSTIAAKRGSEVLAYTANNNSVAQLTISTEATRDMSAHLSAGAIEFYINTTVTDNITLRIADTNGGSSTVVLNENWDKNPSRDGTWQKVIVPFSKLSGNIDYTKVKTFFELNFTSSTNASFAIDEVVWTTQATATDVFGVYTENTAITNKFLIDDVMGHIHTWDNTLFPLEGAPSYEGNEVLAFTSNPLASWFGFGIFSDAGVDLSSFESGYLHFSVKTSSSTEFWIAVQGANNTEAKIIFNETNNPYGFVRNGKWQTLSIPISDLLAKGIDLSSCGNIFCAGGAGKISDLAFDEIIYSQSSSTPTNSGINPNRDNSIGDANTSDKIVGSHYGIYSENTKLDGSFLIDDVSGHIYIWNNTLVAQASSSAEGNEVLSFRSTGAGWHGFGIHTDRAKDLTSFANGYLHVSIKTASTDDFWLGFNDGADRKILFNNGNDPYNFARDGEWHNLVIPMTDFGACELEACGILFASGGTATDGIAFDNIVFATTSTLPDGSSSGQEPTSPETNAITTDVYGIFAENTLIENSFEIDNESGHIYIWENTLSSIDSDPFDGEEVLAFSSSDAGWYGFGIHTDELLDLSHYTKGYLHLSIKTSSTENFWIGFNDGTDNKIEFNNGSDPYSFQRNGEWQSLIIPIEDFASSNMEACRILFMAGGTSIDAIAFDAIFYSLTNAPLYTTDSDNETPSNKSDNAMLTSITINGIAIDGFDANTLAYQVELPAYSTTVPNVIANAHDAAATVAVTNATTTSGTTTIVVTAEDGSTTKTYSVHFRVTQATSVGSASTLVKSYVTRGLLTIENTSALRADIELYNLNGTRVFSKQLHGTINQVDKLQPAIYILRIKIGKQLLSKKIVIQ